MRNPGRIWKVIETGKIAFSYNKEQEQKFMEQNKVLVYITEITQLSLFADLPPKEQCRRVLKDISKMQMIGFLD
jgi:hypothetical protein